MGFFGGGAVAADTVGARARGRPRRAEPALPRVPTRRAATLVAALADDDAEVRRRALVCAEIALPLAPTAADGPPLGATAVRLGDGIGAGAPRRAQGAASLPPRALAAHHRALGNGPPTTTRPRCAAAAAEMVADARSRRRRRRRCGGLRTRCVRGGIGNSRGQGADRRAGRGGGGGAARRASRAARDGVARETGADGGDAVEADAVLQTARRRVGGGLSALWKWMSEGDMLSGARRKGPRRRRRRGKRRGARRPSLLKLLTTERLVAEAAV